MRRVNAVQTLLGLLVFLLFLAACTSPPLPETTEPAPFATLTYTPDPCTGWDCTITGVVYEGEAGSGHEVSGVVVKMSHTSNCSPTKGEHEVVTEEDGAFEFEVFLHDTDFFTIKVELDGHEPVSHAFSGFDCLYCSCKPVEIVLEAKK